MVTKPPSVLAVLPCRTFYSGMGAILDNFPKSAWVTPREFSSLFVEDILQPLGMVMHPDILRNRIVSSDSASIDYAVELILENYDCLHRRLLREFEKTLPFLLTDSYTLENLFLYTGSHSLALRIEEHENKSSLLPYTSTYYL